MKKLIILFSAVILSTAVFAQSPEKMSYQAIVRNASNNLVVNQAVGMRISILQGSAAGTAVYVETQTPSTNANGLASIEIGTGSVVTGSFSGIDWSNGPYFIKTETDPTGGTSYTIAGTSQLLSVPYALYAKSAGNVSIADGSITNAKIAAAAGIPYSKLSLTNSIVNGDITASAITTSKVADGTVTSAKIFDGTIVNADVSPAAAIAYSKLALTNSIVNGDITASAITTSKVADGTVTSAKIFDGTIVNADISPAAAIALSKLGTTGTANSTTYLRGDGTWSSISASSGGISLTSATVGGTTNITITDVNVNAIVVTFAGSAAGTSTVNVTIPAASSYAPGHVLYFIPAAFITSNPSWNITCPGATYSALNSNGVSMNPVALGAGNNFRMVTDGVSNWYRIP